MFSELRIAAAQRERMCKEEEEAVKIVGGDC
jgi:hypothetical protein